MNRKMLQHSRSDSRLCLDDLAIQSEARTPILLPARLGRLGAEGLLLAATDHADAARSHSGVDEILLGGVAAVLTQSQVVLIGSALIAIAANEDLASG